MDVAPPLSFSTNDLSGDVQRVWPPGLHGRNDVELKSVRHFVDVLEIGHAEECVQTIAAGDERWTGQSSAYTASVRSRQLDAAVIVDVHETDNRLTLIRADDDLDDEPAQTRGVV